MNRADARTKRIARVYEWKNGPFSLFLFLSLALSLSLVRLRAFKLDRVQVRPMADVAKLPCDSGFTLSRLVRFAVALFVSLPVSSPSKTEVRMRKNGEIGRCIWRQAHVVILSSRCEINSSSKFTLSFRKRWIKINRWKQTWKIGNNKSDILEEYNTSLFWRI